MHDPRAVELLMQEPLRKRICPLHPLPTEQRAGSHGTQGSAGGAGCRAAGWWLWGCCSPRGDARRRLWLLLAFLPQLLGWRWGQAGGTGGGCDGGHRGAAAAGQVVTGRCEHTCCCLCFPYAGIRVPENALPLTSSWTLPCTKVTPLACSESSPFPRLSVSHPPGITPWYHLLASKPPGEGRC